MERETEGGGARANEEDTNEGETRSIVAGGVVFAECSPVVQEVVGTSADGFHCISSKLVADLLLVTLFHLNR